MNNKKLYEAIKKNEKRLVALWYDTVFLAFTFMVAVLLIILIVIKEYLTVFAILGVWLIITIIIQLCEWVEIKKINKEVENG